MRQTRRADAISQCLAAGSKKPNRALAGEGPRRVEKCISFGVPSFRSAVMSCHRPDLLDWDSLKDYTVILDTEELLPRVHQHPIQCVKQAPWQMIATDIAVFPDHYSMYAFWRTAADLTLKFERAILLLYILTLDGTAASNIVTLKEKLDARMASVKWAEGLGIDGAFVDDAIAKAAEIEEDQAQATSVQPKVKPGPNA